MNYAIFGQWITDRVEELVSFGIPRSEAEHLMKSVEYGGIAAYAGAKNDEQFLLDLKRTGPQVMAKRYHCSDRNIRKRRGMILKRRNPSFRFKFR